jgi:hypothetical protein
MSFSLIKYSGLSTEDICCLGGTAKGAAATALIFAQNIQYPIESIVLGGILYIRWKATCYKSIDKAVESVILFWT